MEVIATHILYCDEDSCAAHEIIPINRALRPVPTTTRESWSCDLASSTSPRDGRVSALPNTILDATENKENLTHQPLGMFSD